MIMRRLRLRLPTTTTTATTGATGALYNDMNDDLTTGTTAATGALNETNDGTCTMNNNTAGTNNAGTNTAGTNTAGMNNAGTNNAGTKAGATTLKSALKPHPRYSNSTCAGSNDTTLNDSALNETTQNDITLNHTTTPQWDAAVADFKNTMTRLFELYRPAQQRTTSTPPTNPKLDNNTDIQEPLPIAGSPTLVNLVQMLNHHDPPFMPHLEDKPPYHCQDEWIRANDLTKHNPIDRGPPFIPIYNK